VPRISLDDPAAQAARRVAVYGVTGSGKSVLAREIAQRKGLEFVCVDDVAFEPGWAEVPTEEQIRRMEAVCAGESWVIDSVYSKWSHVSMPRTQLIVALDYPRIISLSRLVLRTAHRVATGTPVCNGNRETLRQTLSRRSILVWHVVSFPRKRRRIAEWAAASEGPPVLVLRSPREARRWLESLGLSID
jgi:adenylate kinase family enzyme